MAEITSHGSENNGLTEQHQQAKDLFFQSFRFSQGDTLTQRQILKWLVAKGYFDSIEVSGTPPAYIMDAVAPQKHTRRQGFIGDPERVKNIKNMWSEIYHDTEIQQSLSPEALLDQMLSYMISRDTKYQFDERPNRQPSEHVTPDSINDPHASFIRKYIINATPTGNEAFDELHRSLAPLVTQYWNSPPATDPYSTLYIRQTQLSHVAKYWEQNHPGDTFFPAENSN